MLKILFLPYLVFSLFLSSCSQNRPQTDPYTLPLHFVAEDSEEKFVEIDFEEDDFEEIYSFWRNKHFDLIYEEFHPIQGYKLNDVRTVNFFLVHYLKAFYMFDEVQTHPCKPLNKEEIVYLLSYFRAKQWQTHLYDILMISLHEQALRKDLKPVYPEIFLPTLRKLYHLKPRNHFLIESKSKQKKLKNPKRGFIVCRNFH